MHFEDKILSWCCSSCLSKFDFSLRRISDKFQSEALDVHFPIPISIPTEFLCFCLPFILARYESCHRSVHIGETEMALLSIQISSGNIKRASACRSHYNFFRNPTPRNALAVRSFVTFFTPSACAMDIGNREWYHRSAGVKSLHCCVGHTA